LAHTVALQLNFVQTSYLLEADSAEFTELLADGFALISSIGDVDADVDVGVNGDGDSGLDDGNPQDTAQSDYRIPNDEQTHRELPPPLLPMAVKARNLEQVPEPEEDKEEDKRGEEGEGEGEREGEGEGEGDEDKGEEEEKEGYQQEQQQTVEQDESKGDRVFEENASLQNLQTQHEEMKLPRGSALAVPVAALAINDRESVCETNFFSSASRSGSAGRASTLPLCPSSSSPSQSRLIREAQRDRDAHLVALAIAISNYIGTRAVPMSILVYLFVFFSSFLHFANRVRMIELIN
jgi:hypothetical protein